MKTPAEIIYHLRVEGPLLSPFNSVMMLAAADLIESQVRDYAEQGAELLVALNECDLRDVEIHNLKASLKARLERIDALEHQLMERGAILDRLTSRNDMSAKLDILRRDEKDNCGDGGSVFQRGQNPG